MSAPYTQTCFHSLSLFRISLFYNHFSLFKIFIFSCAVHTIHDIRSNRPLNTECAVCAETKWKTNRTETEWWRMKCAVLVVDELFGYEPVADMTSTGLDIHLWIAVTDCINLSRARSFSWKCICRFPYILEIRRIDQSDDYYLPGEKLIFNTSNKGKSFPMNIVKDCPWFVIVCSIKWIRNEWSFFVWKILMWWMRKNKTVYRRRIRSLKFRFTQWLKFFELKVNKIKEIFLLVVVSFCL